MNTCMTQINKFWYFISDISHLSDEENDSKLVLNKPNPQFELMTFIRFP